MTLVAFTYTTYTHIPFSTDADLAFLDLGGDDPLFTRFYRTPFEYPNLNPFFTVSIES